MVDPAFTLAWPKGLFVWEALRVRALPDSQVSAAVHLLIEEAFEDADLTDSLSRYAGSTYARDWLTDLVSDERIVPYRAPVYFAERHGAEEISEPVERRTFAEDFISFVWDFQDLGYFPRALPRECVDDPVHFPTVTAAMQRATKLRVEWPIRTDQADALSDTAVYTLVEYFHDNAQRPRTYGVHEYAGCGRHYADWNREAGGTVYRWRLNELLAAHNVPYRLAPHGPERGRLVRHFGSGLDSLADKIIADHRAEPGDEVAFAVRHYRERGATVAQKRAAITTLANVLEVRRNEIRQKVSKQDETTLFDIANNYGLRHRKGGQRTDYGDEFLDWIFWSYVSMFDLLRTLDARTPSGAPEAEG